MLKSPAYSHGEVQITLDSDNFLSAPRRPDALTHAAHIGVTSLLRIGNSAALCAPSGILSKYAGRVTVARTLISMHALLRYGCAERRRGRRVCANVISHGPTAQRSALRFKTSGSLFSHFLLIYLPAIQERRITLKS